MQYFICHNFLAYTGVLGTISRMAKMCALRLTPTKLYFILTDHAAVGGVSIWCELTQVRSKNVLHIQGWK